MLFEQNVFIMTRSYHEVCKIKTAYVNQKLRIISSRTVPPGNGNTSANWHTFNLLRTDRLLRLTYYAEFICANMVYFMILSAPQTTDDRMAVRLLLVNYHRRRMERRGRVLNEVKSWRTRREPQQPVTTAVVPIEIRNQRCPHTSLPRYR